MPRNGAGPHSAMEELCVSRVSPVERILAHLREERRRMTLVQRIESRDISVILYQILELQMGGPWMLCCNKALLGFLLQNIFKIYVFFVFPSRERKLRKCPMKMVIRVFPLLILFISSYYPAFSLYEDQVEFMEWHQQFMGKSKAHNFPHSEGGKDAHVIVFTKENVIASLVLHFIFAFSKVIRSAEQVAMFACA